MEALINRLDQLEAEVRRLKNENDQLMRRVTVLEQLLPESQNPVKQGEVVMVGQRVTCATNDDQTWAWIPLEATSIASGAFRQCQSLTEVFLPQSGVLSTIRCNAFYQCGSLRSISIPASVQSIESQAFRNCTSLTTVHFAPQSKLTTLGDWVFHGCAKLQSIEIPPLVMRIPTASFFECTTLSSVKLTGPNLIAIDGGSAFGLCTSLKTISFPTSLKRIEDHPSWGAFRECASLEEVKFDGISSIEHLGARCFRDCSALESVEFEKCPKLNRIGELAFTNTKLTSLRLEGTSLVEFGPSAFEGCGALTEVVFPPTLAKVGTMAFAGCVEISDLTFNGSSLAEVGDGAFGDCEKLKEKAPLVVPGSLKVVGVRAFPCGYKAVQKADGEDV